MTISRVAQTTLDDISVGQVDLFIGASGFESRASSIATQANDLGLLSGSMRIAFGFDDWRDDPIRERNDVSLRKLGFKIHLIHQNDSKAVGDIFSDSLRFLKGGSTILIDISSMTRTWYGAIVQILKLCTTISNLEVIFCYSIPKWSDNQQFNIPINEVAPMRGFAAMALPTKPTALVLGVGIDGERGLGLATFLDAGHTVVYLAEKGADERYQAAVKKANRELLTLAKRGKLQLVRYNFAEFETIARKLDATVRALLPDWNVVLCSTGPKPFCLSCFLIASQYDTVSVWRVGAAQSPHNHESIGRPMCLKVSWAGQEF